MSRKSVDYGMVVDQAKDLTLKHKWLWVIGFLLALFSSGGGNGGGGGGSQSSNNATNSSNQESVIQSVQNVLGATTSAIGEWFKSVPVSTWILLVIIIITLVVIGLIIGVVVRNWAKGVLIGGLNQAKSSKNPITLPEVVPHGFANFKNIFWVNVINSLVMFGIIMVSLVAAIVILAASYALEVIGFGIFLLVLFGSVALAIFVVISFVGIYAERLVVLHKFSPTAAWKKGLSLSKGNFLPTAIMGIINNTIGCVVGCLGTIVALMILAVPTIILIIPIFTQGIQALTLARIVSLLVVFIVFSNVNVFVSGVLLVFKFASWNIFVDEILAQEEKL